MIAIDSSSLILLAKLSILDKFIKNLKKKLTITEKVQQECIKKDTFDAKLIQKRIEEKKISKSKIKNKAIYNKILDDFNLGNGEAETITLCIENKIDIITDDKKAINTCKILEINFTTIPNIIIKLYQKKIISKPEVYVYIAKLEKIGRYKKEIIDKIKGDLFENGKNE